MKRFVFLLFVAILAYRLEAHKSVDSVIHAYQTVMSCMNKNKRALPEETVKTIMNCYNMLSTETEVLKSAMKVVRLYETKKEYGPLFINERTCKGISLSKINGNSNDIDCFMYDLQQAILDYAYKPESVLKFNKLIDGFRFLTSDYFPGKCGKRPAGLTSYRADVNVSNRKYWGMPIMVSQLEARRPTGCYVEPGTIVTIEVPEEMVGKGISVLVGSHSWDFISKKRPVLKRLGRVTQTYPIDSTHVVVSTPLGGGIYIQVPYNMDMGWRTISIKNAIRSPFYSYRTHDKMSEDEWKLQRNNPAPWADFESDNILINIPSDWVYDFVGAEQCMENWEKTAFAIKQLRGLCDAEGRPLELNKSLLYLQVDVQMRGNANFPGYPQTNDVYDPYKDYKGNNSGSYILKGGAASPLSNIALHELGHASSISKFRGETEALVNFLFVVAANQKFGYSIDEALGYSFGSNKKLGRDEVARNWIVTKEFVNGEDMSFKYSLNDERGNQMSYQQRGYAKYAEIAALFGWNALSKFWYRDNFSKENGGYYPLNVNDDPVNYRVYRMSKAAGCDLRPLIHFWGIKPATNYRKDLIPTPEALEDSINNAGLKPSRLIYNRLVHYRDEVVPKNLDEFRKHVMIFYPKTPRLDATMGKGEKAKPDFNERYYAKLYYGGYTEEYADSVRAAITSIINMYFSEDFVSVRDSSSQIKLSDKIKIISEDNVFHDTDYFNWCSSIIKGDDGKYHMFYSRWHKSKGFRGWLTHSTVAHSVSDTPSGPYRYVETVLDFERDNYSKDDMITAHNPKIKYFAGKYYLYFISTHMDGDISDDELIDTAKNSSKKQNWNVLRKNQRTFVAVSNSLDGKWVVNPESLIEPSGPITTLAVNPAITQGPDKRYYMIIKGDKPGSKKFERNQALAISDYPDRDFKFQPKPVINDWDTEDVSMWYDNVTRRFYAVFHAHTYIGMMTSLDGINWEKASDYEVMKKRFELSDKVIYPKRLERPFVFIEDNVPKVLSLAVYDKNDSYIITIPLKESDFKF